MILIIGGQRRKIGKTALVETILRAFPERRWTAVKITTHHDPPGRGPKVQIREEREVSPDTDTGRYLAAGAARAYLVRCAPDAVAEACGELKRLGVLEGPAVIESGAAARCVRPRTFVFLVDADPEAEAKGSFQAYSEQADAFVIVATGRPAPAYRLRLPAGRPRFFVPPGNFRSRPLLAFLRERLESAPFSQRREEPRGR